MRNTTWKRIGLMAVLTLLFFVRPSTDASARRMSPVSPSQGEPSSSTPFRTMSAAASGWTPSCIP